MQDQLSTDLGMTAEQAKENIKKEIREFIAEFKESAARKGFVLTKGDTDTITDLELLLEKNVEVTDAIKAYEVYENRLKQIQAIEHTKKEMVSKLVPVQKSGFFRGPYIENELRTVEDNVTYIPLIKNPLSAVIGSLYHTQSQLRATAAEAQKRREKAQRKAQEQSKAAQPGASDTNNTLLEKLTAMEAANQRRDEELQARLASTQQEISKVAEQLDYVVGAAAQAFSALPSNVQQLAFGATGANSNFAIVVKNKMLELTHPGSSEASKPKEGLYTILESVYRAAQGTAAETIRFKIRFVQLLMKLYPQGLFLADIIQRAKKMFSALNLPVEEYDIVDGHLTDYSQIQEHLNVGSVMTEEEHQQFCEFAQRADFHFHAESDLVHFGKTNFKEFSALEGIEKKIRLQLVRNFETSMTKQWLGEKYHAIQNLLEYYKAHKSSGLEALAIKYLIFQLLLHKNDLTIKAIVEKATSFFADKGIKLSDALSTNLNALNTEDDITHMPLSTIECETFDAMLSRKPNNLWLRSDAPAQQMFEKLSTKSELEIVEAVKNAEAQYDGHFLEEVKKLKQKAPRELGAFGKSGATATAKQPVPAAPLQDQQQTQQALASAAAAAALSRSRE